MTGPQRAAPGWRLRVRCRGDRGQVTPWTVIGVVIVIVLGGLVFDQGLAMADKVRLWDAAQAAARAGAREVDLGAYRTSGVIRLDPAAAAATARTFLAEAGLDGTASATDTTVTVTVTAVRRTQLLHLIGITGIPVSATAVAAPVTAVAAP